MRNDLLVTMDEIQEYYENDARKLRKICDYIINKLGFIDIDKEDFYSLANEVFVMAMENYNGTSKFSTFLSSCLTKKFISEMTASNRDKRCNKMEINELDDSGNVVKRIIILQDERLDVKNDENSTSLIDTIPSYMSVEDIVFGNSEWSDEMDTYLNSLSPLQKKIAILLSDGYSSDDICDDLHITKTHYTNSVRKMFTNDKVRILTKLI